METRRVRTLVRILVILATGLLAHPRGAAAQTYEVLHSFLYGQGEPASVLLEAPDGRIYGTTASGGDFNHGSVFLLTPDGVGGYTFEDLHSFSGPDGQIPSGALYRAVDGSVYGVTSYGGPVGQGTFFMIDPGGGFTTLHYFQGAEGSGLAGGVTSGIDGALYGLRESGGSLVRGTLYRVDLAGNVTTLYNFGDIGDPHAPSGVVVPTVDGFYGVGSAGGANALGAVFKIDPNGNLTVLHEFNGADGQYPSRGLALTGGKLYGTTIEGGGSGFGTVFSLEPQTMDFESIHSFAAGEGTSPVGPLLPVGGFLYGAANGGGAHGFGAVFRVDLSNGDTTTLHDFAFGEGANPAAGLIFSSTAAFFGTTLNGTNIGWGTVFRMDALGATSNVHIFFTRTGLYPEAIMLGSDGALYGTATQGGEEGWGLAYRVTTEGAFTMLHGFSLSDDGGYPVSVLLEDGGLFYGTATSGGSTGAGTIFRFDADGNFENVHDFDDTTEGNTPVGGLIKATDSNFYGTTLFGGADSQGAVYKMTPSLGVTRIHSFSGSEGSFPRGQLVEGANQKLYGTTYGGSGTAYRIDFAGNLEPLHTFDPVTEGSSPYVGLLLAQDGLFYGTLESNIIGAGSMFRMDSSGATSIIHAFDPVVQGTAPHGELLEDGDGGFFGTCSHGGTLAGGTLFNLDSNGDISNVHAFPFPETPVGALAKSAGGDLYGVTETGGAAGYGSVYHVAPGGLVSTLTGVIPTSGRAAGGTEMRILGTHFAPNVQVSVGGAAAGAVLGIDSTTVLAISPALPAGTLVDIAVTPSGVAEAPAAVLLAGWMVDFTDVPRTDPFHDFVESIFRAGITAGYGNGYYGRNDPVTREQMAVFLLKAEHGSTFDPPDCTGVFTDVPCTPGVGFPDWIEQLYAEAITGGCIANPLQYCPGRTVTRAEMAVFLLKTKHGTGYTPPVCAGLFADVPCPSTPQFPFSDWIEQLYVEQVTGGCATGPLRYCPDAANLRGEMAVFLTKTFALQ